jgi:hypothetical protein
MNWKRLLAYITGSVDQELVLRNEYLLTENRILKNQIKGRLRLTHLERISADRSTGNDSWVAPEVDCKEVRRFKAANVRWSSCDKPNGKGFGPSVGSGESQLGIPANCRRPEQSGTRNQPPNGGQFAEAARRDAGARTWKEDPLGRTSSARIWKQWRPSISSRLKSGRRAD